MKKIVENLKVAVVQNDVLWLETSRNLEHLAELLQQLSSVDLILLPEMFATGFAVQNCEVADEAPAIVEWMQQMAREKCCAVVGSVAVREDDNLYNRLLFVQPNATTDFYDKRHLFPLSKEPMTFQKGENLSVFTYKGWRFCPQICYDLRFPVWCRNRYDKENGFAYDCLLCVANWPASRSRAWNALLTARAIENQSYLLAANRIGADFNGVAHCGDSQILSPEGTPLISAQPNTPQLLTATLSYQRLTEYRNNFPVFCDWD